MTFREPLLLLGLALVPLALAAYVVAQRRRRRFAVRYTNVDLLASVAARSGWTRHIPALLALLALAALLVALGRPERTVAAEQRQAMVVMVTDTSGSMLATDVKPTRLDAAKAAGNALADKLPRDFRLGLVGFGSTASLLVEPTTDKLRVRAGLEGLEFAGKTAMGDGLAQGPGGGADAGDQRARRAAAAAGRDRAALGRRQHGRHQRPDHGRRARAPAADPDLHGRARHRRRLHHPHAPRRHDLARVRAARHRHAAGDRARDARALLPGRRRRSG